jgi:hypothetical protein
VIAALKMPKQGSMLIGVARAIAQAMNGNKAFPTPDPSVATLQTAISDLDVAENQAKTGLKSAFAARNQKRKALYLLLEQEKHYVQKIADADPDRAHEIIVSAGMSAMKVPIRTKRVFTARQTPVSGTVELFTARVATRAAYEWQYSADGGKTWQSVAQTLKAKTLVSGLQPAVVYAFRFRSVTKSGLSDWSDAVTLVVK